MKIGMPYALNEMGKRSNQEDSVFPPKGDATPLTRLFMVCDGMGGHENGEVASGLVCSTFGANLANIDHNTFTVAVFEQTLDAAYNALDAADPSPESQRKMGTTLTMLYIGDKEVVAAHMGDSRVYHVRPSAENPILYQSYDHSLVNELVRAEIITPEEALTHPRRNVIMRAMQPHLDPRHKADVRTIKDVAAGDYFFLCSDGILESLSNDVLVEILRRRVSDVEKVEAIKELCTASSNDNFSAYLIPVVEGIARVKPLVITAELVEEDVPRAVHCETPSCEPVSQPRRRKLLTPLNIILASTVAIFLLILFSLVFNCIDFSSILKCKSERCESTEMVEQSKRVKEKPNREKATDDEGTPNDSHARVSPDNVDKSKPNSK